MSGDAVDEALALVDWRRQIAELYAFVRAATDRRRAWTVWHETRTRLFHGHGQSPIPASERPTYTGPHVYPYDPAWRALAELAPASPVQLQLPTSRGEVMTAGRFARAHFTAAGTDLALDLYLLEGYGGGLFLPFADATSGRDTYGAGRYLLDTVKGADLGLQDGRLVLDFNFAYQPSCSYDPRWVCPLAPAANRLPVPVRAGERLRPS